MKHNTYICTLAIQYNKKGSTEVNTLTLRMYAFL